MHDRTTHEFPPSPTMGKPAPDVQHVPQSDEPIRTNDNDTTDTYAPPTPSLRLLFSYCSRRDVYFHVLPAITVSLAAGSVAPFMTHVIGQAFDAMANFTSPSDPGASHKLMHKISIVSLELLALALGQLIFSSLVSSIWLSLGERIVMRLRAKVYEAVTTRDIEWFDQLGQSDDGEDKNSESVGAGGLMAKFVRETDDVRAAVSTNMGMIIEYGATCIAALVLALVQCWSLALVTLASIPLMVIVQIVSERLSGPLYQVERQEVASAATKIERAVASIATVKAFNAADSEISAVSALLDSSVRSYKKCAAIWAGATGMSQFVLYSMFVQGFWYGAHLAGEGKVSPGTVMSVFWACVVASSNLMLMIPLLMVMTKGKTAMVSLEEMIHPPPSPPKQNTYENEHGKKSQDSILPTYYESVSSAPTALDRSTSSSNTLILRRPLRCLGTFDIPHGLRFSYASRPNAPPALRISSKTPIHIAGADLTFFVGGSGSGKSTLAQLLMQLYRADAPTHGAILMDEIPFEELDPSWVREQVALVSQECILFNLSVHDNVAIGKRSLARPGETVEVTREQVEVACRVAMVHDFVRDMPDGYDTVLGTGGASLSGGQRQRVALARAILRDPAVLILDEATSALDAMSRVLVFEAIKHHRRRKTTIVITHDLSQITDDDYVYVMKAGRVVEEGFRADLTAVKPASTTTSPTTPHTPFARAVSSALEIEEMEREEADLQMADLEFQVADTGAGEFRRMLEKQLRSGGFPVRDDLPEVYEHARAEADQVIERVLSPEPSIGAAEGAAMSVQAAVRHHQGQASASGLLPVPSEIVRPGSALSMREAWTGGVMGSTSNATGAAPPSSFARHTSKKRKRASVPWQVDAMRDILGSSTALNSAAQPRGPSSSKMPPRLITPRYSSHRGKRASQDSDDEGLMSDPFEFDDDDDETVHEYSDDDEDTTKSIHPDGPVPPIVIPKRKRVLSHRRNASTSSLPSPSPDRTEFGMTSIQSAMATAPKRQSMTFEPWVHPTTRFQSPSEVVHEEIMDDDDSFTDEKNAMQRSGAHVQNRRQNTLNVIAHNSSTQLPPVDGEEVEDDRVPSLFGVARQFYHTVPRKGWIALGLVCAMINGALTPIFSWALARLIAGIGVGATGQSKSTEYGLVVLFAAIADGLFFGLKFFLLEDGAMHWVASLRKSSFARIMRQDKTWFDRTKNSPDRLVQILIKDGDDARTLIATVAGQTLIVATMIGLGLGWALVIGWQVTLVAMAIGPAFALAMMGQSVLTSKYELRNKRAREEVARKYYEVVSNIRAIRSMALEGVFARQFDGLLLEARRTGIHGAFASGLSNGVANALIYATEALLFYVGSKYIANGTYSYLRLVEVLNLLIFSVTIGGQMMAFVPLMTKAKQAASDYGKLLKLDTTTSESRGLMRFPVKGDVCFEDVHFSYATRSNVPVLKGINATIHQGECVAIVGASGSGKSTIGALLQRLYEPSSGRISIGGFALADADVAWLRHHVTVVSQHPNLFDASIAANITYGSEPGTVSQAEIERAARAASLHEFIETLPNGYETSIGEKAALLSGGQAQRLQIARALVNGRANIMVFDECTSALDPANQTAVLDTIMDVKEGRTTMLITHKLAVMQVCDRILVVDGGRVVEEGRFDELMSRRGEFYRLASAGEWASVD